MDGHNPRITTIHLDDVGRALVRADIKRYLRVELRSVAPTDEQVKQLVDRTDIMFSCAALFVRFILLEDLRSRSSQRLELVLSMIFESTNKHAYIDALYAIILRTVLNECEDEQGKPDNVSGVLWTVLFSQDAIRIETSATLSGIDDPEQVKSALHPLQPVIFYSEQSELVSTLDTSFPEFMLSRERSGAFFFDIAEHSRLIVEWCFEVVKSELRFNICALESSFVANRDVEDLDDLIKQHISLTLAYVCRHWANHLELAARSDQLMERLEEFVGRRLLFWMEVMNVERDMQLRIVALMEANQWVKVVGSDSLELAVLVADAYDFMTRYSVSPISQSTAQIYISVLPFCPQSIKVYQRYQKRMLGVFDANGSMMGYRKMAALASPKLIISSNIIELSPYGCRLVTGYLGGTVDIRDTYDGTLLVGPLPYTACYLGRVVT
ncbi:hypothetical protein B0J17DRAFT_135394 [Rhizoctonia solani]|nr:hypothetical protein B0J17DRAFT_135394 [Rhizoctonia solani]